MSVLIPLSFEHHSIRVVLVDEQPWWIATDLCAVLGLHNTHRALSKLDDDQKGIQTLNTPGGEQRLSIVSESGMWTLVTRSNKPAAKRFMRWLTGDVLPSLRRTGTYAMPGLAPAVPADPLHPLADGASLSTRISTVNTAMRLFGAAAARSVWASLGLPLPALAALDLPQSEVDAITLRPWLVTRDSATAQEACIALGEAPEQARRPAINHRGADALRAAGWTNIRTESRPGHFGQVAVFRPNPNASTIEPFQAPKAGV